MKIVFFGSSEFAVPSLEMFLDSSHDVLAVVTQPDRQKGRKLKVTQTPVKEIALSRKIKVYQPENVCDPKSLDFLRSLSADLFIVVAFGQILSSEALEIPELYSLNLHPSVLPKYRGAAPINWAILCGEKKTGLSIIRMNERMDAGDIMLQRKVEIEEDDTSETLGRRLSYLGAILLLDAVRFIEAGKITFKRQPKKSPKIAPMLKKEDGEINWNNGALEIYNKIRGTLPWPGAYTYFNDKKINIWKAGVLSGKAPAGEILEADKKLIVGTKQGLLEIQELQMEGKKRMPAEKFLRGFREMERGGKFRV